MIGFLVRATVLLLSMPCLASECEMTVAFKQPNANVPAKATNVWGDADGKALLFTVPLNVNTDGTRKSYSVEDFWGETKALNNLCNAMSDACKGLDRKGKHNRRALTQKAMADGWPSDEITQTKIDPQIIPFKDGKPCPAVDGYLVSATALHRKVIKDACDLANYVDALTVPAIVLPKKPKDGESEFARRGAAIGDLIVAIVPGGQPVYGVVGDTGPAGRLGEGSIALNGRLLGRRDTPRTYHQVRDGWVVPRATVLVFSRSRDVNDPLMTRERIDQAARKKFEEWGGTDRLTACAQAQ